MDLGAYVQIDDLENVAKANGIDCPRIRGYRLMKNEEPVDYKLLESYIDADFDCAVDLCTAKPFWSINPCWYEGSYETDLKINKYTTGDRWDLDKPHRVKWEKIHGWKRKALKLAIKNKRKAIAKQYEMYNKYCGRDDILYIHARIGGGNWSYYYDKVIHQPWFIEKIDDNFDSTYCDIYAKLTEIPNEV